MRAQPLEAFCAGCLLLLSAAGCYQRTDIGPDCADSGCDGGAHERRCTYAELSGTPTSRVDILFVVDNSGSMQEEQQVLAEQFELGIRTLLSGPFLIDDLHIGVISTDMGTHGHRIMTCQPAIGGDDGVLWNEGHLEGCQPEYSAPECLLDECPWLAHSPEWPDDGSTSSNPPLWEDFACVAILGTRGCGFEQTLESAFVALGRQAEPGGANEGFLRDDSLFVVVFLTDEDDCSTPSEDIFDPDQDELGPMNTRCAMNPDELYPIDRYHDGLLDLRPGREDTIVVAGILGIPIDGTWNPGDSIERLAELQQPNPENPNELLPTCMTGMGLAFPPVRIAELIYRFGFNGWLTSICQSDWTMLFGSLEWTIGQLHVGSCLAREAVDVNHERCRLVETLSDDRPCPQPADVPNADRASGWHVDVGLESGRRQCEVLTTDYDDDGRPDGPSDCAEDDLERCLQGWYYSRNHPPCLRGRLMLTSPEILAEDSEARFECQADSCP